MSTATNTPKYIRDIDYVETINRFPFKKKDVNVGIDEVAVSSVAGPMISCLVAMPKEHNIKELPVDSKVLTEEKITELAAKIEEVAYYVGFAIMSSERVTISGTHLTRLYLNKRNAIEFRKISTTPIILDGLEELKGVEKVTSVRQAENKHIGVSAASILAKHKSNQIMREFHLQYPQYGFDTNKGHLTKEHKKALLKFGPSPIHRAHTKESRILERKERVVQNRRPMFVFNGRYELSYYQWGFVLEELEKTYCLNTELLGTFGFNFFSNVRKLPYGRFTIKMKNCLEKIYFETVRNAEEKKLQIFDDTKQMWLFDEKKIHYIEINRKTNVIIQNYSFFENQLTDKDKLLIKNIVFKKNKELDISLQEMESFRNTCTRLSIQ